MKRKTILTMLLLACSMTVVAQQYPFQNVKLSAEERAADLVSRLTLEEKASQMMNTSPAIPRLGIAGFQWWSEALHGIGRNGTATVFPITMGMAASFDDELLYRVFDAVSDEGRAKYETAKREGSFEQNRGLSFWTPNINIFRDPRWGRGQETYGEDPYLTARMGLAVVEGLQGGRTQNKYYKLLACAKHFAVHSGPEWNRHSFNIEDLPARDLYETYLPAFKTLVQQGDVREVMCAYQRFEGEPCCGSNRLLQQILRNDWNYTGIVTSDCGAVSDFWEPGRHGVAKTPAEASSKAVLSGTDVECGDVYKSLPEAVKAGFISEAQVDRSLRRLFVERIKLGTLDSDSLVSWTKIPQSVIASKEHKALAYEMARRSMVLLQNRNNLLPLRKSGQRIVVMGPNAADSTMLWGNYNGFPTHTTTILAGIQEKSVSVRYVKGCGLMRNVVEPKAAGEKSTEVAEEQILHQVGDADVVVFVGGISPRLEGEEMPVDEPGFRGGDRTDIELPQAQRDIIMKLHQMGKRVVFVNCSGSAVGLVPESRHADAIVQAWYGGEFGGKAVADVLFGDYNPSGKLPVTFYKNVGQLPDFEDYRMAGRTYRYFKGEPQFPFGFGLSYTTFKLSNLTYDAQRGVVEIDVKNTGKRDGAETVQIYVRNKADKNGPLKSLRAFKHVEVKAGKTSHVSLEFPRESFEGWDESTNTMRMMPGNYQLSTASTQTPDQLTLDIMLR